MKYSQEQPRECLQCETPISGRSDKEFCGSACKARYNRENEKEQPAVTPQSTPSYDFKQPPSPLQRVPLVVAAYNEDEEDDLQLEIERQSKDLHRAYTKLVNSFLKEEGYAFDSNWLDEFIENLDEAAVEYRQHPGLQTPSHPAHNRLADLYLIRDYLRELREQVEDADEAVSFFGRPEPDTVCIEISKKRRKRLRESMLGVA